MICAQCGTAGKPKSRGMNGSFLVEILLWFFFILPGLIYSIWRIASPQGKVCRACGSPSMIPLDSPRGRSLAQQPSLPISQTAASARPGGSAPPARRDHAKTVLGFALLAGFIFVVLAVSLHSGDDPKPASIVLASAPVAAKPIRPATPLSASQRAALAKRNAEAQLYAEKRQTAVYLAAIAAKQLHDGARNPDSFKLSEVLIMPSDASCFTYRAQNGFGGMNVEQAIVTTKGRMFTQDADEFVPLWNKECANKTGDDETAKIAIMARLN